MKQEQIREMLKHKISRERIGVEFRKTILGANPVYGLRLINEVGFTQIFNFGELEVTHKPQDEEFFQYNLNQGVSDSLTDVVEKLPTVLQKVGQVPELNTLLNQVFTVENEKMAFYLTLILYRWRDVTATSGKRTKLASNWLVVEGLKLSLKIANLVGLISANRHQFQKIFQNAEDYTRAEIAMKVIKPFTEHWKMNVLVNSVLDSFEDMNHVDETLLKATQFFKTCDLS
ncbi:unnamed protein product [Ambrosiozyma monospora]|uniref:Unnamed protein product n=1 Tax=Ambrosiozyma monospora TaxID=43982 RepID=A0A9W6WM39_AMBMO|nr:unnamed protein product [Ambrosiozyma monospora]